MKKLLAIFIIFTGFASYTFAQISVYGSAGAGAKLVKGSFAKDDEVKAGDFFIQGTLGADAKNEDDTFGGVVTVKADTSPDLTSTTADSASANLYSVELRVSAWWRPILPVKLELGTIDAFALTEIVGWGYHANDAEDYVISPPFSYVGRDFTYITGFYSGTGSDWTGAALSVTPIYGLEFNVTVPFSRGNPFKLVKYDETGTFINLITSEKEIQPNASNVYKYCQAQAAYTLHGIGRFALTLAGRGNGTQNFEGVLNNYEVKANTSSAYASFLWTQFEKLSFNFGLEYVLPAKDNHFHITYQPPMAAGVGMSLDFDKYGIRARLGATFLGNASQKGGPMFWEPVKLNLGILPYLKIGPWTIYANMGASYSIGEELKVDVKTDEDTNVTSGRIAVVKNSAAFGWFFNPYITVNVGPGTFFAGLRLETDGHRYTRDAETGIFIPNDILGSVIIEWAVPIGILFQIY